MQTHSRVRAGEGEGGPPGRGAAPLGGVVAWHGVMGSVYLSTLDRSFGLDLRILAREGQPRHYIHWAAAR